MYEFMYKPHQGTCMASVTWIKTKPKNCIHFQKGLFAVPPFIILSANLGSFYTPCSFWGTKKPKKEHTIGSMVFSNSVKPKFDLVLGFSWYLFWFNCQVTSKDCPWFFISQGKVKKSKILFCLVSHHESQYKLVYHKSWVGEVEEALLGNPCPTFLHFHVSPNYAVDTRLS